MITSRALGIIFPNLHDDSLPELVGHRAMGSLPFAGRYRMIDFCLSGMASAGIQNVGVIARQNYQSLMDHLGNGREWDLTRKRGGLFIFPPFARDGSEVYRGRIQALASVMPYLERWPEELVVLSDCNIAMNLDYRALLAAHRESGADVTVVYDKAAVRPGMEKDNFAFALNEEGRVTGIRINEYKKGVHNLSMNVFVIGRELLINVVREATARGDNGFVKDYLAKNLKRIQVHGHEFTGHRARIYNMQSYFEESLRLLDMKNLAGLFPPRRPIQTKVRDEAPVRYAIGAVSKNSLVADGCIIEGTVENSVLFRGVRVGKGSHLKNCVVMQGTGIGANVAMENVITDKNVTIGDGQSLRGAESFPVYIAKGCTVL